MVWWDFPSWLPNCRSDRWRALLATIRWEACLNSLDFHLRTFLAALATDGLSVRLCEGVSVLSGTCLSHQRWLWLAPRSPEFTVRTAVIYVVYWRFLVITPTEFWSRKYAGKSLIKFFLSFENHRHISVRILADLPGRSSNYHDRPFQYILFKKFVNFFFPVIRIFKKLDNNSNVWQVVREVSRLKIPVFQCTWVDNHFMIHFLASFGHLWVQSVFSCEASSARLLDNH